MVYGWIPNGSQSVAQGAAASASLEILLEMEIIGLHLKPTESETGVTPAICFKSRLGGFDVC